jgi:chromate transporter
LGVLPDTEQGAPPSGPATDPDHGVSFAEAARFWVKLGFVNFGGPTGQIAIMHEELVERRRWISSARFLHALNYCMLLPGPEAQQLAVYVGWLLHKVRGGLVAGIAFVLPAFFLILGLSYSYVTYGDVGWVAAIFSGLRAAVIGIVAAALIRIATKALRNWAMYAVAALAFVGIFVAHVPFPVVVLGAGLLGLIVGPLAPSLFAAGAPEGKAATAISDVGSAGSHTDVRLRRSLTVLAVGLAVWLLPLVAVAMWRGSGDTLTEEARFFSQAALVTFGGAYAVLAYINQAAVTQFGWLSAGQTVVGLGLAESTPGPLIMVTEFVGFVGAYQHPGGLDPVLAGVLGATVTTWATFAPCFLWIFLGAPFVERLRGNERLSMALGTITAAVVGVILNLALWFAIHTLFSSVHDVAILGARIPVPVLSTIDWFATTVAVAAFVALGRFRVNVVAVVAASAVAGLVHSAIA